MVVSHFLSSVELPAGTDREVFWLGLERLADEANELGIRARETWYSIQEGRAFTLFDSDSQERVEELHRRAGITGARIMPIERVNTQLLSLPHRRS